MPQEPERRGRRRGLAIGAIGVVVVGLVVGAGVFAWAKLSGGGPQPAEAVPSDAMAYVRLDLDPSAEQKLNAMSLLGKFPEFEDATGIADDDVDLRKLFVEEVMSSDDCDLSYADDIEPWIGDRLGFALVGGDEPTPMLAVQVSDEGKAEDGAEKIADCTGGLGMQAPAAVAPTGGIDDVAYSSDEEPSDEASSLGVAFSGDYMIVAPTQDSADDLAKDAEKDSLATSKKFSDDMDALDGQGFASAWFDGEELSGMAEQMGVSAGEMGGLADAGSGAVALRAGDDYLEVVSTSGAAGDAGAKADVGGLPESTLFAASVSGGGPMIEKAWGQLESSLPMMGPDLQYMLTDIEVSTGLSLPDDLATLLGEQFMVGVDSEGLAPDSDASLITDFNAGIRMTSDPAELGPVIDKLTARLESAAGPGAADDIFSEETGDGMVLATNEDYASKLTDGGGDLGGSDAYQKAVPAGDDAVNVVYANFDEIVKIAPEDEQEVVEQLDPVQAFGLSTKVDGDRAFVTARLTFD